MPLYEYVCTVKDCPGEVEILQHHDDPPPTCPEDTSHGPMKRVVPDHTSFKLEGGGWADDGYSG
jgi:putative FmdB family regulatory protein